MTKQKELEEYKDPSDKKDNNKKSTEKLKIKELGEIITGNTPSTNEPENYGGDIPFVRAKDINKGTIIEDTEKTITQKGLEKVGKNKLIPKKSIMVTCIGAKLGEVAISKKKCLTNQQINSLITSDEHDTWYVYYNLLNNKKKLKNYAGGSAQPILSKSKFGDIKLKTHSYRQQKKIGYILGSLDKKIEVNNNINQLLEEIAQTIFKHWFVDFEPYEEFKDSEIGKIPKEFEVGNIKELLTLRNGKYIKKEKQSKDGKYPVYGANGQINKTNEKNVKERCITIGRVGSIGEIHRVEEEAWISDNCIIAKPKEKVGFNYIYFLLKRLGLKKINQGSSHPMITQEAIKSRQIPVPPIEYLQKFEKNVEMYFERILSLKKENEKLMRIRDTLLPKLMSGEIRVDDIEFE
ncbi:Restriction endonuclease S subunit [Methanonatronarchaeum thermophilum]|uniref:Restriction endonuclease S subunit n=1 Tax=Methanonatronarchaeum thermophilum TaxID=1927129 RepID=A0A1Y3GFC1_9EURY|nr:restriction endonuclease subunit S [Methanonatronarchaeum thermophilum]OUJ18894.1 Restriction endonuclease S subunit [Methanonatronarchaeum thermophilum]